MRKLLLALVLTAVSLAAISPLATAAPGAVRCGQLLDVRTGRLLKDQVIVFDADGTITAVGPTGSPLSAGGATTVDLPSATCLPGLIDVHTHLTDDPTSNGYEGLGISVPREAITGVKNARLTVHAGFT